MPLEYDEELGIQRPASNLKVFMIILGLAVAVVVSTDIAIQCWADSHLDYPVGKIGEVEER